MPSVEYIAGLVDMENHAHHLSIVLRGNPGPFPYGVPGTLGKAQYIGIAQHLVLTLIEDRYLAGLPAFQADLPRTPAGQDVHWCGGVQAQPDRGDIRYCIHPLFIRDMEQLLGGVKSLRLAVQIAGARGRVTGRQYWLVEIPSITAGVLLNLDEIVIVRRRHEYRPPVKMGTSTVRGAFWQCGAFAESTILGAKKQAARTGT